MKYALLILVCLSSLVCAQQQATLSGIIKTDGDVAEGTKVAIHIVDKDGVWQREVNNVAPVAGTFNLVTKDVPADELSTLRSGSILLPGLQNEYKVNPEQGVNYALGRPSMYVDANDNGVFDRVIDAVYIGIPSLEEPVGFFTLIYVDQTVTFTGRGVDLVFEPGWNIFNVRYPQDGDEMYSVQPLVDDIVLDVFLP